MLDVFEQLFILFIASVLLMHRITLLYEKVNDVLVNTMITVYK